jgi:Gluconate 2-dehydrogenase subunit 3
MQRRDLFRALGAATALAFIPRDAFAAWERVASGIRPAAGLSDAHLALVGAVADAIIPRTDSPGATDVNVPAFIDVIVSENYTDAERTAFLAGLDVLDSWTPVSVALQAADSTSVHVTRPVPFANVSAEGRAQILDAIEQAPSRRGEPMRTYWRLKGLVIHGYFTSERVSKDVLHVEVMPGRFEGSAPLPTKAASSSSRETHDHA